MLRSRLGEDLYRRAIKLYLDRHGLSSVVTDDLRQAFEEVTGKPLDAFFDQWVYHGDAPELSVRYKWFPEQKLLRVTVKQDREANSQTLLFTFPVTLRAHTAGGVIDRRVEVTEAKQDFYLPLPAKPEVVRFDPEYSVLAEVDHDKPQVMLEKQLELEGDMIGRLFAAKALGKVKNQAATDALAAALTDDPFYGVRAAAADALGEQQTSAALQSLLANRAAPDARVRLRVVKALGRFLFDEAAYDALMEIADRSENPDIRGEAFIRLARFASPAIGERLLEELGGESLHGHTAASAIDALGRRRDSDLAEPMLSALRGMRFSLQGRRYGQALVALGRVWQGAEDRTPAREWLEHNTHDHNRSVRLGAIEALGRLGEPAAMARLEALVRESGQVGAEAERAIARLDAEASHGPVGMKELRNQVRELRKQQEELQATVERLEAQGEASESDEG